MISYVHHSSPTRQFLPELLLSFHTELYNLENELCKTLLIAVLNSLFRYKCLFSKPFKILSIQMTKHFLELCPDIYTVYIHGIYVPRCIHGRCALNMFPIQCEHSCGSQSPLIKVCEVAASGNAVFQELFPVPCLSLPQQWSCCWQDQWERWHSCGDSCGRWLDLGVCADWGVAWAVKAASLKRKGL